MSDTVTRPMPRNSHNGGHVAQQPSAPQAIPVARQVSPSEPPGQRKTYLERNRTAGLASRRARDLAIVLIVIGVPLVAAVPLIRPLKQPIPVDARTVHSADGSPNQFVETVPTDVTPQLSEEPKAPAATAADVYEFLTVMRGHPFITEEDKQRLLGYPDSTINSDRGGLLCTHCYDGGVVMYRYDPEGPGVIRDLAIRKATEQPRSDFEPGAFDFGGSRLRVKEFRDYCLAMQTRSIRSESPQAVAKEGAANVRPPAPARQSTEPPTKAPQNLTATAQETQNAASRPSVDNGPRTWASADGRFACEAAFLKFEDSKVYLKKTDDSIVAVSMYALSDEDQLLIRDVLERRRATASAPDTAQADSAHETETVGGVFGSLFSDAS